MKAEAFEELNALLEGERAAIVAGQYERLGALLPRKEELMSGLASAEHSADITGLARKVQRNQALLGAAIEGVRTARGQVQAIRGQQDGFKTYGPNGGRQQVGGQASVIERKV